MNATNKPSGRIFFDRTAKVLFLVLVLVIAYLFALNGRYSHTGESLYFDKWTNKALIFNPDTGNFEHLK